VCTTGCTQPWPPACDIWIRGAASHCRRCDPNYELYTTETAGSLIRPVTCGSHFTWDKREQGGQAGQRRRVNPAAAASATTISGVVESRERRPLREQVFAVRNRRTKKGCRPLVILWLCLAQRVASFWSAAPSWIALPQRDTVARGFLCLGTSRVWGRGPGWTGGCGSWEPNAWRGADQPTPLPMRLSRSCHLAATSSLSLATPKMETGSTRMHREIEARTAGTAMLNERGQAAGGAW